MPDERRSQVPSVERVLAALRESRSQSPHSLALEATRGVLARVRARLSAGEPAPPLQEVVAEVLDALAASQRPALEPVINGSGVILQTNLGRAPLSERAIAAMASVARGYSNLEFDLHEGARGSRHKHVRDLIRRTTGAEDGLVVNNNAAGLFMALQVFARDREVIVSRGQAVEIGGGFRIPDVLRQGGARLVEVGTTNRTYARDYADAVTLDTAAILRVHSSNFRVIGFTAEASLADLAALARERGLMLLDDLGSGCLIDTTEFGLAHEPTVQESVSAGVDLALFSGDKLLGGPQCGIIAGRERHVEILRRHPLARALRVDKLTIAALNATLQSYVESRHREEIPIWRMLSIPTASLRRRARRWAAAAGEAGAVVPSRSMVGGGSLPGEGVETWCAAIKPPGGADRLAAVLRAGAPPIVGRIHDDALLLDPRTVDPKDDGPIEKAVAGAVGKGKL
ncbi:MAG TPA: L-seryl-tRNA(Sec) selenium transferase [Tepidiformaceae bacterium]|nr:L-seryl-tRNA(Sec) selenium transferase [Tepidiformaceae bacterium]